MQTTVPTRVGLAQARPNDANEHFINGNLPIHAINCVCGKSFSSYGLIKMLLMVVSPLSDIMNFAMSLLTLYCLPDIFNYEQMFVHRCIQPFC